MRTGELIFCTYLKKSISKNQEPNCKFAKWLFWFLEIEFFR
jgi:hypothetical protein